MRDVVQQDFGGFDQKFLGISVTIGSEQIFRVLYDRWRNARGPTTAEIIVQPRDQAMASISALTVLSHELRHFHDFLITPVGSLLFSTRLFALLNVLEFLAAIWPAARKGEWNCIPIPIPRWCAMSEDQRISLLNDWNGIAQSRGREEIRVPTLPYLITSRALVGDAVQIQSLPELVATIASYYDRIDRLTMGHWTSSTNGGLLAAHVQEASAVMVQVQEVWNGYGEECCNLFLDELQAHGGLYTRPLWLLQEAANLHGRQIEMDAASVAINWCLLGDPLDEGEFGSPIARFALLWKHLCTNDYPVSRSNGRPDVKRWFDVWDRELARGKSSFATLRASLARDERGLSRLEFACTTARARGATGLGEFDRTVAAYSQYVAARRWCVERYLTDPSQYVFPGQYLQSLEMFEQAPIKLVFNGSVTAEGPFVQDVYLAAVRGDGAEEALIVRPSLELPGVSHVDIDTVFNLYSNLTISDVLFRGSSMGLEQHDTELVRQEFKSAFNLMRVIQ